MVLHLVYLVIYLVIFEKENFFIHYLHVLQIIFVFFERKRKEKGSFLMYLAEQQIVHIILILFCIFLDNETISFIIQPSDSASIPTISTVHPKLVTT